VAAQTRPPDRLLLVDDGSSDGSAGIAYDFARRHLYAKVLHRTSRPFDRDRLATASEWQAFAWAVEQVDEPFDLVAKLDADLVLSVNVFAEIEARFSADRRLGMAGPHLGEMGARNERVRLGGRPEHVHGATKFYRRECYEEIVPIPAVHGWDMVDEVKARSRGWRTSSFEISSGDCLHRRPMGTQDGALRGFRRWGQGDYVNGVHPLIVLTVAFHRLNRRPRVVGSLNYLLGWAVGSLRRMPRMESDLRAFARKEQLDRIRHRLTHRVDKVRRTA
jgi:glycosyltransferase involved in cell wall biosynthesis